MSEEEKAIENVKNMFEGITIKSLNKDSKMTIYSLGIADILLFINAFDKQQKEIEKQAKEIGRQDRSIHKLNLDKIQQQKEIEHWKAGMKIIEKDKNNHIERLERKIKEKEELKKNIKEIMRKDRDCLTFGYYSAYVGLLDDLIKLIEEE